MCKIIVKLLWNYCEIIVKLLCMGLHSNACAMHAWGLYEGMRFTRNEADDFLTELFNYLTHRSARKEWSAELDYSEDYSHARDELIVSWPKSEYKNEWFVKSEIDYNEDDPFDELQWLSRVSVYFKHGDDRIKSYFVYMTSRDTLEGFYYFSMLNLTTRCRCVSECLALLDAVASDLGAIVSIQHSLHAI